VLKIIKKLSFQVLPPSVAGNLRTWRVHQLVRSYQTRIIERTYGSGTLRVLLADPLGEGWYDHDWTDLPEITALRKTRLLPGARVFDIGAHQGIVALMLAREVGASGLVVAVEPNPHNASVAEENRKLNGVAQVDIVQAAVSDQQGSVVFNAGLNGQLDDGSGAGGQLSVESVTIDSLADRFGLPDVVFMDVEGAECLALAGASEVLAASVDFFIEVHVACGLEKLGGSVDQVLSYFPRHRFTLLARAESDAAFHSLRDDDPVMLQRFFLLALSGRATTRCES